MLFAGGGPEGLLFFLTLFLETGTKTTPKIFQVTIKVIILRAEGIGKQIGLTLSEESL
jgi:hypothetical protein